MGHTPICAVRGAAHFRAGDRDSRQWLSQRPLRAAHKTIQIEDLVQEDFRGVWQERCDGQTAWQRFGRHERRRTPK